jgi:hypothetical protein
MKKKPKKKESPQARNGRYLGRIAAALESLVEMHRLALAPVGPAGIETAPTPTEPSVPFLCEIATDGRTPAQLVSAIESKGRKVWPYAKGICLGEGKDPFPETTSGQTYRLGVVFASELGKYPTNAQVWAEMERRGAQKPHPEVALCLREKYSQAELLTEVNSLRPSGPPEVTWVIVMHEPVRDSYGSSSLLGLSRGGGEDVVNAYYVGDPGYEWGAGDAFVVLLPQES